MDDEPYEAVGMTPTNQTTTKLNKADQFDGFDRGKGINDFIYKTLRRRADVPPTTPAKNTHGGSRPASIIVVFDEDRSGFRFIETSAARLRKLEKDGSIVSKDGRKLTASNLRKASRDRSSLPVRSKMGETAHLVSITKEEFGRLKRMSSYDESIGKYIFQKRKPDKMEQNPRREKRKAISRREKRKAISGMERNPRLEKRNAITKLKPQKRNKPKKKKPLLTPPDGFRIGSIPSPFQFKE